MFLYICLCFNMSNQGLTVKDIYANNGYSCRFFARCEYVSASIFCVLVET